MKIQDYKKAIEESSFKGKILENENMSAHSTMKVGGKASLFLSPENEDSLVLAASLALKSNIRFFVIGGGSNLIFSDSGFSGVIICTESLSKIELQQEKNELLLKCGAGIKSNEISEFCEKNLLSGFEAFAGLPGSAGGAVFMNARCYGDEFSNHIKNVSYLDLDDLKTKTYEFNRNDWQYKKSPFQDGKKIILGVRLCGIKKLEKNSEEAKNSAEAARKNFENRRAKGHFDFPSAGSVFKNNHAFGKPSGAIIDECGLKGLEIGGAQVAPWHGNFIINRGTATADDIKNLVEEIQKKVMEKTGFSLESEVIFV